MPGGGSGLKEGQRVFRQGSRLVADQLVHGRCIRNRRQPGDEDLELSQGRRGQGVGQCEHGGKGDGDGRKEEDQNKGGDAGKRESDFEGEGNQDEGQNEIHHEEGADDLENRRLGMASCLGVVDELDGPAVGAVISSLRHHPRSFPAPHDRSGEEGVSRSFLDRKGFSGKGRLVEQGGSGAEDHVGRDKVAHADMDQIPRNDPSGGHRRPDPVPAHAGHHLHLVPEQTEGGFSFFFLPEGESPVQEKERNDDQSFEPLSGGDLEGEGRLEHPGNGTPELSGQNPQGGGFTKRNCVGPDPGQSLPGNGLGEAVWGGVSPVGCRKRGLHASL